MQASHQYLVLHHRLLTILLIALARITERVDESLLPAVYLYVGCSFGATPAQLGSITFVRSVVQALASPLGGILGRSPLQSGRRTGNLKETFAKATICFVLDMHMC